MDPFSTISQLHSNFSTLYNSDQIKDDFTININNKEIVLNVQYAALFLSEINRLLKSDQTTRSLSIKIDNMDDNNLELILKFIQTGDYPQSFLDMSDEKLLRDMAQVGVKLGCNTLIQPYRIYLSSNQSKYTLDNILHFIEVKQELCRTYQEETDKKYKDEPDKNSKEELYRKFKEEFNIEFDFCAINFEKLKESYDLVNWSRDINNYVAIEEILNNPNLLLESEDSLLDFVIDVCKDNDEFSYLQLFSSVRLEYCTLEYVEKLVKFIENLGISLNTKALLNCLLRRCLKIDKIEGLDFKSIRYSPKDYEVISNVKFDSNNRRNGLLNNQHKENNLVLHASSNHNIKNQNLGNIYKLLEFEDGYTFISENKPDTYIEASLKNNNSFIINKYLIRGGMNGPPTYSFQLEKWALEGKRDDNDDEWELIDAHNETKPFGKYEEKVFEIHNNTPFKSVRLRQIGPNHSNSNFLFINGFELYGKIVKILPKDEKPTN